MPNYSLSKKDAAYLTIEIGGKNYNLPLAKTMKVKDIKKIMKAMKKDQIDAIEDICNFLSAYMSEELVEDLNMADILEIFELWIAANKAADGISLGESSASPNS